MKTKIIIDCDPGFDDVVALFYALSNKENLDILGVTTVAGNQTLEKTTRNAKKVMTYFDEKEIGVYRGAEKPIIRKLTIADHVHGKEGINGFDVSEKLIEEKEQTAHEFLVETLKKEDKVHIVAVGPLTNIAILLLAHPELKDKIEAISIMGGGVKSGNVTPSAEFNIYVDPEAAKIVFASGILINMFGLDVTHKATLNDNDIEMLSKENSQKAKDIAKIMIENTHFHRKYNVVEFPLHDVCPVMNIVKPGMFKSKKMHVDIDDSYGPCAGKTICDLRGTYDKEKVNANVFLEVDKKEFVEELKRALLK